MRRVINSNVIAANAFISTNRIILESEQVERYVEIVREKTNYKTDFFIGGFDINNFVKQFDFAFAMSKDKKYVYVLNNVKDREVLIGYFRHDLGGKYNKLLNKSGLDLFHDEEMAQSKELIKRK